MNILATGIPLFPKANSTHATHVDLLYGYLNLVSVFFTVLIFAAVIYFSIRYRRRSNDDRPAEIHGSNLLEIAWSVIPFLMTLVMFWYGTKLHFNQAYAPENAMELLVTGKQWMWKVQHPNGKREINDLTVPVGVPIKLTITSEDVIHSYYIPVFRLKRDAVPGKYTGMWFEAEREGTHRIFCAEYCGTEHSVMVGKIHVVSQEEYKNWLDSNGGGGATTTDVAASGSSEMTLAQRGEALFSKQLSPALPACSTCHLGPTAGIVAPKLDKLWGSPVFPHGNSSMQLVKAKNAAEKAQVKDMAYIRESIREPLKKLAVKEDGTSVWPPAMPPGYADALSEEDIQALAAYIHSLSFKY